jgi:hypothetical protein
VSDYKCISFTVHWTIPAPFLTGVTEIFSNEDIVRTVLIILGIWLLANLLFVVLIAPAGKTTSIRLMIISAGMSAYSAFTPPLIEAIHSLRRTLKRQPPERGD